MELGGEERGQATHDTPPKITTAAAQNPINLAQRYPASTQTVSTAKKYKKSFNDMISFLSSSQHLKLMRLNKFGATRPSRTTRLTLPPKNALYS